jgi:hypothetical protein
LRNFTGDTIDLFRSLNPQFRPGHLFPETLSLVGGYCVLLVPAGLCFTWLILVDMIAGFLWKLNT